MRQEVDWWQKKQILVRVFVYLIFVWTSCVFLLSGELLAVIAAVSTLRSLCSVEAWSLIYKGEHNEDQLKLPTGTYEVRRYVVSILDNCCIPWNISGKTPCSVCFYRNAHGHVNSRCFGAFDKQTQPVANHKSALATPDQKVTLRFASIYIFSSFTRAYRQV